MPRVGDGKLEEALRPIESLISKSEKARAKLAPGTWQHSMLGDRLDALHLARDLMRSDGARVPKPSQAQVAKALRAFASMIEKSERAMEAFDAGTSPHTLQKNRLRALRMGAATIRAASRRRAR